MKVYFLFQGYGWLKDRILSDEGRRQQAKLRELRVVADRVGCSLAQLAIGELHRRQLWEEGVGALGELYQCLLDILHVL